MHPVVPPRVDYEFTHLGHSLNAIVRQLLAWTIRHADEIDAARAAYGAELEERECTGVTGL